MKSVAFYTLGCKLNFSETSTIARIFESEGYKKVDFTEDPDIFVINTCSVTDNADKKCRKIVREARSVNPDAFITLIGCYAQLKPGEIARIQGVDAILGANEKFRLLELLGDFRKNGEAKIFASDIREVEKYHSSFSINDRTRTFLKIQDGCNYGCAFCTIPLARGKSRSDSIEHVVAMANDIGVTDVKEIVLTGVNTGDFGIRNGRRKERFIDLIKELDQTEGIERFRISSIEPNLLTDDIIEFVADSDKFVPHFHVPLQSGSDKILQAMGRRYRKQLYEERIKTIKSLMPHACIGVDVIVGFPGETDDDLLETYEFLNYLEISYLHVFPYSERPNTRAVQFSNKLPDQIKTQRSKMLRGLSHKKKRLFYEENLLSSREVLFEHDVEKGSINGFTDNYIRVKIPFDPALINTIQPVNLDKIDHDGIVQGSIAIEETI